MSIRWGGRIALYWRAASRWWCKGGSWWRRWWRHRRDPSKVLLIEKMICLLPIVNRGSAPSEGVFHIRRLHTGNRVPHREACSSGCSVLYMLAADKDDFPIRLPARLYSCPPENGSAAASCGLHNAKWRFASIGIDETKAVLHYIISIDSCEERT